VKGRNFLKIIELDELASTNDCAFSLAQEGQAEVTVIRARAQTRGRGRRQKRWVSPKDKGIYASFILRPLNPLSDVLFMPLFFAFAVTKALAGILPAYVKWPNDIMVKEKKIGGILAEARVSSERADFVILGIGLNVNSTRDQVPRGATSLYLATRRKHDIKDIFRRVVKEFLSLYPEFRRGRIEEIAQEILTRQPRDAVLGRNLKGLLSQRSLRHKAVNVGRDLITLR
jgi:BirA family biotin operon repressor/biotin-[acetyl-CoA-carboxylase] ligase